MEWGGLGEYPNHSDDLDDRFVENTDGLASSV